MTKTVLVRICIYFIYFLVSKSAIAQNSSSSVLVNFGRDNCGSSLWDSDVSLFGNALSASPTRLLTYNTGAIGHIFSKFISYNPLNNKLYINDISDGANSKIHIMDVGLPTNLVAPTVGSPNYQINGLVLNQFEFDPLGDLYAIDNYNYGNSRANLSAYDDTSGRVLAGSVKTLVFPPANRPTDVGSGDLAATPSGRMFCIFGSDTSRIYEITNYRRTQSGNAVATYLGITPKVCYGIAYDNGSLILSGSNFGGTCYTYKYDINDFTLGPEVTAAGNSLPIDLSSFSPAVGTSMRLSSATWVSTNTYDLAYQVFIQNKGNVRAGNVNLSVNLARIFGSSNILSVSKAWIANNASLNINSGFNGTSDTNLLASNQTISNTPITNNNSLMQIIVRATNLIPGRTYLLSSVASASIGSGASVLSIKDSSNNYNTTISNWASAVDPDNNSVSDDVNENNPTPWQYSSPLPVSLLSFTAECNSNTVDIKWTTASEKNNDFFTVQKSVDGKEFTDVVQIPGNGSSNSQHSYSWVDENPQNNVVYYRLRQVDYDGTEKLYQIIAVKCSNVEHSSIKVNAYPVPFKEDLTIELEGTYASEMVIDIVSNGGSIVYQSVLNESSSKLFINESKKWQSGLYVIMIIGKDGILSKKVIEKG